jgi:hypothetical protein
MVFTGNPIDLLGPLGKSPIHIPLETNLSTLNENTAFNGLSLHRLRDFTRRQGVANQIYWCRTAFWIVHHDAIETVCALAIDFLSNAKTAGLALDVSAALGYAMQILCADPEAHLLTNHPRLWASDNAGLFRDALPDGSPWAWERAFAREKIQIQPAIIHLPRSRQLLS